MTKPRCHRKCPNTCEACTYQQICQGCSDHCIYHFIREDYCTYQLALSCKKCPFTMFELETYESYPIEMLDEWIHLANESQNNIRQPETIPQLIPIIDPYNLYSHFHHWQDAPDGLGINIWNTIYDMKRINAFAVMGFKGFLDFKAHNYSGKVFAFSIPPDRIAATFDIHSIGLFAARLDYTYTPTLSADVLALSDILDYTDLPKRWTWNHLIRYLAAWAHLKQNLLPDIIDLEEIPEDWTEDQLNTYSSQWRHQRREFLERGWIVKQGLSPHFRNLAWEVADGLYSYLLRVNLIPFLGGAHLDQFRFCAEKLRKLGFNHAILNVTEWARYHRWKQIQERIELARTLGFDQIIAYGLNPGKIPSHAFLADSYATEEFFTDATMNLRYTMKGRVLKDTLRAYRECSCRSCQFGPDYKTPMGLAKHNLLIMKKRLEKFEGV